MWIFVLCIVESKEIVYFDADRLENQLFHARGLSDVTFIYAVISQTWFYIVSH